MQRTLKRELKELEVVEMEAFVFSGCHQYAVKEAVLRPHPVFHVRRIGGATVAILLARWAG